MAAMVGCVATVRQLNTRATAMTLGYNSLNCEPNSNRATEKPMIDEIRARVEQALDSAEVAVAGEGNRFQIDVVSEGFEGMNRVKRQQQVYAAIGDLIAAGTIHAVTITASTPAERG